jgi:DNA invertase Pin-like site-specific DNA recombinase
MRSFRSIGGELARLVTARLPVPRSLRALLDRVEGNGVRVVIVEDATRFARDLMAQELGIVALLKLGMQVFAANGDDLTVTDDPMKKAMRQMAGVFAELEKSRLVAKLRAARDRKRAENGDVGQYLVHTHWPRLNAAPRDDSRFRRDWN